jgi:hypothetical protein
MDQVIPEALFSARSSKRVRFDNNDWNKKIKRDSDSGQEAPMQRVSKQKTKPKKMDISNNDSAENQFLQVSNSGQFNELPSNFIQRRAALLPTPGSETKHLSLNFSLQTKLYPGKLEQRKKGSCTF